MGGGARVLIKRDVGWVILVYWIGGGIGIALLGIDTS